MSEILSKVNTNTGLIFSLKGQVDASNAFFQQEIDDLQNEKQNTIEVSETFIEKAIETWSSHTTDGRSRPHGMIWCGEKGLFVSANVLTGGGVFPISTSTDGLNWVGRQVLDSSGEVYTDWIFGSSVAWSKELNLFVAVSIDALSELIPERKQIVTSTDGLIWTILDQTFNRQYIDVVWAKELGLFVAVSSSTDTTNQVLISADGLNWVQQNIPSDLGAYQSVCWSPQLGLLVAVRTGVLGVATSTDGINWTPRTTPNNGHFQIDWSPSLRLFAVCSVGTGDPLPVPQPPINTKMMTSPDGINWTYQTTPNNLGYRGVAWCSNLGYFVSASTTNGFFNNRLIYSKDGVNWSLIQLPNRWTNRCICYSNDLGLIIIGQDSNNLSNFLTSSLQGRPPTSYNVFDSDFNRIDQDGRWTIKAKELYSQGELNVIADGDLFLKNKADGETSQRVVVESNSSIELLAKQGYFGVNSDTSRMEMGLFENTGGSGLIFAGDPSGGEMSSNNKLTLQAGGDLVIKHQGEDLTNKVSIESNSIIELKPAVGSNVNIVGNVDISGDLDMSGNDILQVNNIDVSTINGTAYPPNYIETLQDVLTNGNTATELSAILTGAGSFGTLNNTLTKSKVEIKDADNLGNYQFSLLERDNLQFAFNSPLGSFDMTIKGDSNGGLCGIQHTDLSPTPSNLTLASNKNLVFTSNNIDLSTNGQLILPSLASNAYLRYNPTTANELLYSNSANAGGGFPMLSLFQNNTATGSANLRFQKNTTTIGSPLGELAFYGRDATAGNPYREFARIKTAIRNNTAPSNIDGSIDFLALINGNLTELMRINGQNSEIEFYQPIDLNSNAIKSATGNIELNSTSSTGFGDINLTAKRDINLVNSSSTLNSINLVTSYIALHTSASDTGEVNILTDVLSFTGLNLESDTAGGNSGQHLRIKLNGVFYKIKLENDA